MAKKMIKIENVFEVYHCDIFRFCDRWCEKCKHTSNCFFYNLITSNNDKEISIDKPEIKQNNAIMTELGSFADAIEHNTVPSVTINDGYHALEVAYQILEKISY